MLSYFKSVMLLCVFHLAVVAAVPAISSVSPTSGTIAGNTQVTISGTDLSSPTSVTFAGLPGVIVSSTLTTIVVKTPAHAMGVVDVGVTTAGGSTTKAGGFTYGPMITGLTPNEADGPAALNISVTIAGNNLTGTTSVLFGGVPATVVSSSLTSVSVKLPAHANALVDVVLTAAEGTITVVNGFSFVPRNAPAFSSQPSSLPQVDGEVPSVSTGQSEALVVVGKTFTYYLSACGNPTPTLSIIKSPDATMTLANNSSPDNFCAIRKLTWVPTTPGVYDVSVKATNTLGTIQQDFRIRVIPAPSALLVDGINVKLNAAGGRPLKVMCMGDSITNGSLTYRNGFIGSYRAKLLSLLTDAGYSVQMVGRLTEHNPSGRTDLNHEGNSGFRVGYNLSSWYSAALINLVDGTTCKTVEQSTPDVVVLMGGNLDLNISNIPSPFAYDTFARDRMGALIDAIQNPINNGNTQPRIIVLPIMHSTPTNGMNKIDWNRARDAWNIGAGITVNGSLAARTQSGAANVVTTRQQVGKRVSFADANRMSVKNDYRFDPNSQTNAAGMLADDLHPNADTSENALAQAAFRAFLDVTPGALGHDVIPSPPSGMTAVINASVPNVTALDVAWTVNSRNEDNFDVDWSQNADFSSAVTTTFAAGTSATTLSGLPSGAILYLRVRARNAGGVSWYCPPIQVITANGPPTIVTISTGTVNQLTVTSGTQNLASTTFVGGGTLQKTGTGTVQWGPSIATFAMDAGALIDVQGGTLIGGLNSNEVWTGNLASLNVVAGATFDGGDANVRLGVLSGAGTIKSAASITFGVDNGNGTFSGVLANGGTSGSFIKAGTGTQILSGTNTYTGGTVIRTGTVIAASNGVFGSGPVTLVDSQSASNDNVTLLTSGAVTILNPINFNIYSDAYGVATIGGTTADSSVFSGSMRLDKNVVMTAAAGGTVTFSGVMAPFYALTYKYSTGITKVGAGTVILANTDTCTGPIVINQGTLALGSAGSISNAVSVSIAAGAVFDVSAIANCIASSSTSLNASGVGTIVGATAATITCSSINLGAQPINLTFTPTTFTSDTTHPALYVQTGTLSLSNNPFTITNASTAPLDVGTYTMIQQANGGVTGSVSSSTVTVTGMGLVAGTTASMSIVAGTVNLVVTVVQNTQSFLSFTPIGNQIFGVAPLSLSATTSSNLPPTFSVISGPATVNGATLTITGTGTVVVAADQAGNANYLAAPQVTQSITVIQNTQSFLSFTPIGNQTFGAAPLSLSATTSSNLPPTFSVISGPATVNGTMLTITGAGTVVVAADQAGDANYQAAPQVTQSITVAQNTQSFLSFTPIGNQTFGVASLSLSATTSSNLSPTFSVISGPATVNGTTLTITGAGTVVVAADQAGDANYQAAPQVTQSITVAASTQTITFPAIGNQTYGVAPLTLSATATSGLPPVFSVVSGPATVNGTMLTITGAGTVVVAADQAGDANYLAATQVTQSITVAASTQTITFPAIGNQTYGVAPLTLSATATSGLPPVFSVVSGPATVNGTMLTITGAGTVVVAADQAGDANYLAATQVTQSITVAASTQTITFPAIGNQTYGVVPLTLSATATSGLASTFSVISGPALLSGNTLTITSVGTIVVAANQSGNGNYQAAPTVSQTITVALPTNAVSLKGSDAGGASSLTGATNWTNGLAPSGLNDYFASYVLRTPATSAGAITFAGKSLTLMNGGTLVFKGSNVITINKLILNGGSIRNWYTGSNPDWAKLAGTITLAGNADLRCSSANNETMEILAPITGGSASGSLTIMVEGAYLGTRVLLSAVNTYVSKTVIASSTLTLSGTGSISNSVSIAIAAGATFDVSQKSSYVLSSATSLIASGAASPAIIKGGMTINLGSQPINLTFSPTTFTGDVTRPALTIAAGTLSLANNPITITNASGTALGTGTYRLIQQVIGNVGGSVTGSPLTIAGSGVAAGCMASLLIDAGNVNVVVVPAAQTVTN